MDSLAELLEELAGHCDLQQRLHELPATARVRGVYFRGIENALHGRGQLSRFRQLFPLRPSTVLWYPATEFLLQLAVGGALLTDPARVHSGMFEIGRSNATVFVESLIGRLLLRFLSRDPRQLLEQALIGQRQGNSHSQWSLCFLDDHSARMSMSDEYLYIDSYLLGAAQGTFEAVSLPVQVEAQLQDRYHGHHLLRW